jgi:hypothetical protein
MSAYEFAIHQKAPAHPLAVIVGINVPSMREIKFGKRFWRAFSEPFGPRCIQRSDVN